MKDRPVPNPLIHQLLRVADYAIRLERRTLKLPDLEILQLYGNEEREAKKILNEVITDQAKETIKQEFLDLIHQKVTMINGIAESFDKEKLPLNACWGAVKEVLKKLSVFFRDSYDRSEVGFEKLSMTLEKVINYLKGLNLPSKFFRTPGVKNLKSLNEASQIKIKELCDLVINKDGRKRSNLSDGIGQIGVVEEAHATKKIPTPDNLIRKLIDASKIESGLYDCIDRLVA